MARTPRWLTHLLLAHGAAGGIIAGIVFAVAEMVMNALMFERFFGSLRLISSIVLGAPALEPSYPFAAVIITGVAVHVVLSAFFGLIYAVILKFANAGTSRRELIFYGFLYGTALWLVNFWVVAPVLFPQFTQLNQFWHGFIAHTVCYGMVLGWYTALVRPQQLEMNDLVAARPRRFG